MIPVIWFNAHPKDCHPKQHWDTAIFQELILKGYEDWNGKPEDFPKQAVVMIAGRFHFDDVDAINRTLGFLDGCVVVIHSDEESLFPWQEVKHPNMRMWVMTPDPSTPRADFVRFIGEGWSPETPALVGVPFWGGKADVVRQIDVAFLGQVTHPRRRELAAVMEAHRGEGTRIEDMVVPSWLFRGTESFGAGMDRPDYIKALRQSKFAPCPSGPVTADSFRVYEALEAGCIPILDGIDGKGRKARHLWRLMLGHGQPLPILDDWADLPEFLAMNLGRWDTDVRIVRDWWADRKRDWVREMADDVKAISDGG